MNTTNNTSSGRDVPVDITLWDAVWRIFGVCISPVGSLSLCAYDLLVAWKFTAVACLVSAVLFLQFFSWLIQTQGLMKTAVWGAGMTWYKSTGEAGGNFLKQVHVLWKGLYDSCSKPDRKGDIGIKFIVWDVFCMTIIYFVFFLFALGITIFVLSVATLCSCFYRHKAEDNPQVPEPPPAHQEIPIPAGLNPAYVGAFRQFIGGPAPQSQPPPPSAPAAPAPAVMQPQVDMNALVFAALMAEFAKRQENTLNSGEAPQTTGNDKKRARDGAEGEAGVENRKRTRQELEDALDAIRRQEEALKAELAGSQDASGEDMATDDPPAAPTTGKGGRKRQA